MDKKELHNHLLSYPKSSIDFPFGKDVAVYKVDVDGEGKMFALVPEDKEPLQISLKCDPQLAKILRDTYETVLEGYHLNKKHWNTILLTGQVPVTDLQDLILHSYNLVSGTSSTLPSVMTA